MDERQIIPELATILRVTNLGFANGVATRGQGLFTTNQGRKKIEIEDQANFTLKRLS